MNDKFADIIESCMEIMNDCGYKLPLITFELNGRLSKTLGRCSKNGANGYKIEMSTNYTNGCIETGNIRQLEDTILHEMCHALPNGFNHGEGWKRYINKINNAYGYNIERMSSVPNEVREFTVKDGVYICCDKCNRRTLTGRNKKVVKQIYLYSCKCGGKLSIEE